MVKVESKQNWTVYDLKRQDPEWKWLILTHTVFASVCSHKLAVFTLTANTFVYIVIESGARIVSLMMG